MVLIIPPEGWVSAHATDLAAKGGIAAVPRSGPPPLTKVSQSTFLSLDLEPTVADNGWKTLFLRGIQSKIVWAGTAVSVCLLGVMIWAWMASSPSIAETPQTVADSPKIESPKLVEKSPPTAKPDSIEKSVEKIELETIEPLPAPVAVAAAPAEPKPPEDKPVAPKVAEVTPAETKVEPKPIEAKPVDENPPETKTVEAKKVEDKPIDAEPALANLENPPAAGFAAMNTAIPPSPALTPQVEINPLPVAETPPLPITAAKLVKQVPPSEIDVESRLNDVIPSLELQDVPFAQALAIVSSLSTLPITLDADAMKWQGVSARDPITVKLTEATVEKLLEEIASRRGMAIESDKGQIIVTLPGEQTETLRTVRYTVSDICEKGTTAADLAELVQKFVSPDTWQAHGGQGSIKDENGALKIEQIGAVHREVVVFCEKLRVARGLALRSKLDAKRFHLPSAYAQARPLLDKKISANFHEPTTLSQILDNLASRSGMEIVLDRRALAAAGMSDKMEISYTVVKKPLETVLDDLLRPLKLGYRAVDASTLQVTTQKELDRRFDWEFYPVGHLLDADLTGRDLIVRVRQSVIPSSWSGRGAIVFDSPSKTVLVSQTPTVQAALSRYLADKPPKK